MPSSDRPIPTALCLDVEDIVAPASDDAALWMAREMEAHGLRASLFVMGELARRWVQRGRFDVIEAVAAHDVGFHSTWHSVHPTTTELCAPLDVRQGIADLWAREHDGWADAERALGRPLLGWGRTGGSWAPAPMAIMGAMRRFYAYSPVSLPGHSVCWYAGCLGFAGEGTGFFDSAFADPDAFDARLCGLDAEIERCLAAPRADAEWLCVFVCHPTRAVHQCFWDAVNFERGANPPEPEWRAAPAIPAERMAAVRGAFTALCRRLREDPRLEIVGVGELARRYGNQDASVSHAAVMEFAQSVSRSGEVAFTDRFTAAEMLRAMCLALTEPAGSYAREFAFGPLRMPAPHDPVDLPAPDVCAATAGLLRDGPGGYLPADVPVGGRAVGIGAFFVAVARVLCGATVVRAHAIDPWPPSAADHIAASAEAMIREWVIHPPGMDLANLLEQTRLQCWTVKPAHL